ncbi:ParB N-terminal domain-containing protein [Candidatus Gracilibacteria bacterium]|nr:ParB N-terminal domain-containing protein [Candidatus Gracilibacteria bacterium]
MLDKFKGKNLLEDNDETEIIVKRYGRFVTLTKELLDSIDFEDKTYINRIYDSFSELEINELKKDISENGLLNPIYLVEKNNLKYVLVAGLRRSICLKELFSEGVSIDGKHRVVIFDSSTPYEKLDKISIAENTKRKDLTILEQANKINKEANINNISLDELREKYNMSERNFRRIKNSIKFPDEIKNIIEEVGITRASLLNTVFKHLKDKISLKEIILLYKGYSKRELEFLIKNLKKEKKIVSNVAFKKVKNHISIDINKKIPEHVSNFLQKIMESIDNDDFSFVK